jgi:hypothetical protein
VFILSRSLRTETMETPCYGSRRSQANICGAVLMVSRQEGHSSDSAWPMRCMCLRVGSVGRSWWTYLIAKSSCLYSSMLSVLACDSRLSLENPVVPSIFRHEMLFESPDYWLLGRAVAVGDFSSDYGSTSDRDRGFRCRNGG